MVQTKAIPFAFLTAVLFIVIAVPVFAAPPDDVEWTTLTSYRDVRHMRVINDTLYMATSGGILAVTETSAPGRKYNNLDGLGTVNITDIMRDTDGATWVTAFGRLVKITGGTFRQYLFFNADNQLFGLLTAVDEDDHLWVGTDIGLVLFSKTIDGGQIQDSYTLFGDLNPSPAVYDILLEGDSIWLATSAGLAVADKSLPLLMKSPANWTVFGAAGYPELGTDTVRRVVSFESEIYLATANGLFRLDRSPADTILTQMPIGQGRDFTDAHIENDSLFLFYNGGMAVLKDGGITSLPTTGLPSSPRTGARLNGVRWTAAVSGGVFYQQTASFVEYPYTGAPGNVVSALAVNAIGDLTAGLTVDSAAQFVDSVWYALPIGVGARSTRVIADPSGNAWVGTFGNGLWLITDSNAVNYDETNSTLIGNSDDPPNGRRYVVIHGLATDGRFIYVACYRAVTGYPIAIGDLERLNDRSAWDSLGAEDGLNDIFVSTLDYHAGHIAVGTQTNGIYDCYLGPDPYDRRDDSCVHFTESNSLLLSDVINIVRFAPTGEIWAGTNFGLSRYDRGIDRFVDVPLPSGFGPDITALEFDGRGNAWIGSPNNGLLRRDVTTGELTHLTNLNSGLVANDISYLFFDTYTGDLYIGTGSGISVYPSAIATPTAAIDSVLAFPNPFVIRSDDDRLSFNYAATGTVTLFTVAGEKVTEFSVNTQWDGRNEAGTMVASGLYLFVLTGDNGDVARGKILVVRDR